MNKLIMTMLLCTVHIDSTWDNYISKNITVMSNKHSALLKCDGNSMPQEINGEPTIKTTYTTCHLDSQLIVNADKSCRAKESVIYQITNDSKPTYELDQLNTYFNIMVFMAKMEQIVNKNALDFIKDPIDIQEIYKYYCVASNGHDDDYYRVGISLVNDVIQGFQHGQYDIGTAQHEEFSSESRDATLKLFIKLKKVMNDNPQNFAHCIAIISMLIDLRTPHLSLVTNNMYDLLFMREFVDNFGDLLHIKSVNLLCSSIKLEEAKAIMNSTNALSVLETPYNQLQSLANVAKQLHDNEMKRREELIQSIPSNLDLSALMKSVEQNSDILKLLMNVAKSPKKFAMASALQGRISADLITHLNTFVQQ